MNLVVTTLVGYEHFRMCIVEMPSVIVSVHCECPSTSLPSQNEDAIGGVGALQIVYNASTKPLYTGKTLLLRRLPLRSNRKTLNKMFERNSRYGSCAQLI